MSGRILSTGLAAATMIPAAVAGVASAEQAPSNPINENYPGSVVGFGPFGFHEELPDRGTEGIQDPRLKNCVELVLGSFRQSSFKTVEKGKKVRTEVKADDVTECADIVDRTIDIHVDMTTERERDIIGVKERGLDPNSKVRVLNSDNTISDKARLRLFKKPTKRTKEFQLVVGVNATDKITGEDYRETYRAKAR